MNANKTENASSVAQVDVDYMDLNELSALRQKLDGAMEAMMKKKRRAAQDQIRELAAGLQISVGELLSDMPEASEVGDKKPKTKLKPKYRNADCTEEWSGRGRTPKWVLEYVGVEKLDRDDPEHVAKLDELEIKA